MSKFPHSRAHDRRGLRRAAAVLSFAFLASLALASGEPGDVNASAPAPAASTTTRVPGTAFDLQLVLIPGDPEKSIKPFYMTKTEVTWDAFDAFVYRLDEGGKIEPGSHEESEKLRKQAQTAQADAVTRPSKPYLPPDRGFGHEGFAAIGMSHKNAAEFCKWLSKKTGRTFRLAREDEWEHAARAGGSGPFGTSASNIELTDVKALADFAVFAESSSDAPEAVGGKKPNAFGLHDMLGNVQEWVDGRDGTPVTKGGSYRDDADELEITDRVPANRNWNASDPQVPKSLWWLADGPFIGFRVVMEVPGEKDHDPSTSQPETPATPSPTPSPTSQDQPSASSPKP